MKPGLADVLFARSLFDVGSFREVLVSCGNVAVAGGYDLEPTVTSFARDGNGWEHALREVLVADAEHFDYVLLDCSPTMGRLTTLALAAATEVLVPVQTEYLAARQVTAIMAETEAMRSRLNPELTVAGFLPTMYDERTRHSVETLMRIFEEADRYEVRSYNPIPRTIRFAEAAEHGVPITSYAPRSVASLAYTVLAEEIDEALVADGLHDAPVDEVPSFDAGPWESLGEELLPPAPYQASPPPFEP